MISAFERRARRARRWLRKYPVLDPVVNRIGIVVWKRHIRRETRHGRLVPDPTKIVWIDPRAVHRAMWAEHLVSVAGASQRNSLGQVRGGSWDEETFPVEEHPVVAAAVEHLAQGVPWEQTRLAVAARRAIDAGAPIFKFRTLDDIERLGRKFDDLHEQIVRTGFRTQAELSTDRPWDEITLAFDHLGRSVFVEGAHRFAIARVLGIPRVPAVVSVRHADWVRFESELRSYIDDRGGRSYQPLLHPDLADVPFAHGHERFDLITSALEERSGRLLDIGANSGYFCHRFEELGFDCVAVERSQREHYFLEGLRDAAELHFEAIRASLTDVPLGGFDVVLALNVFHHFLKTQDTFEALGAVLDRLDTRYLVFEPHLPSEPQMQDAYRNFDPEQFVEFVSQRTRLPTVSQIGVVEDGRPVFVLSRERSTRIPDRVDQTG